MRSLSLRLLPSYLQLLLFLFLSKTCTYVTSLTDVDDGSFFEELNAVLRNGNSRSRSTTKQETVTTDTTTITTETNSPMPIIVASTKRQQDETAMLLSGVTQRADAMIVVALYPDLFPQDMGFVLSTYPGGDVMAQQPVGFLSDDPRDQAYTLIVQVTEGANYNLTVLDDFGDGLEAPGFFGVYYGSTGGSNELFVQVGFEEKAATRVFTVKRPDTVAPTESFQPSTSPSPTHQPTNCINVEENAFEVVDKERDYTPHFRTDESVYGVDNCAPHDNYAGCTNERKQDCQWQFLGTSLRKGVCRVDPIAACLANGNCVCETTDFNGGSAFMADGLLFHAPISVTSRDIGPFKLEYYETVADPTKQTQDGATHPQDDTFFISRVDFTSRELTYHFAAVNSDVFLSLADNFSLAFKLHYLYWDTPMVGNIWSGVGSTVGIDTTKNIILINDVSYQLPAPLKRWTCTSIVLTSTTLYVGRTIIPRDLKQEKEPVNSDDSEIVLGPFTGELFDVRVYNGIMVWTEISEYGARCTSPDDPAALNYKRDIENPYYIYGCDPDFERLPADEGGPVPTGTEGHTYGSGPFATLWLEPRIDPFNPNEYKDIGEGQFDEEHYFQQAKIQAYLWEKFLFHIDMIAFNQGPYREFKSADQVPQFSATFWNNPCRHLHNFNNGWQFPIYGNAITKWTAEEHSVGDAVDQVFDLGTLYRNRAEWAGIAFVAHELFHGVQGHIGDIYAGAPSRWMAESTAEFGAETVFPAARKIIAPLTLSPSYPLGMNVIRDAERGEHFLTDELSINEWVRGGHLYGGWVLWWFLAEHAGLPHLIGETYSNWFQKSTYTTGELYYLRELVENSNMDFGDVWATCIAHLRTWDFPEFGPLYEDTEKEDFQKLMDNPDIDPPIDRSTTLEGRKTTVNINAEVGTNGDNVAGPSELRPGPNGWNCLTMRGVASDKHVSIKLVWDDGMGFAPAFEPAFLPLQQGACDQDDRFYNSVVVVHNEGTGERRYWKLKGKAPPTLNISTGRDGPVTIHVLMVPTPPSDYVMGIVTKENGQDGRAHPIPVYSYEYSVDVGSKKPSGVFPKAAEMEYGITKFMPATPGWWPVECTCLERIDSEGNRCVRPTFDGALSEPPSIVPPPPETPGTPAGPLFCFSGNSLVHVKNKGSTSMKNLELGDEVLVERDTFSQVYSFGHRHETLSGEYLKLFTDKSSPPLEISPGHMVFLSDGRAVPALSLQVGDQLESALTGGQVSTLLAIERVISEGAYAPFTFSGKIIVNGIKASSYVALQDSQLLKLGRLTTPLSYHWMAHASQLPHRFYCAYVNSCTTERYSESGLSIWVARSHAVAQWLLGQIPLVMAFIMIPITLLLALFALVGSILC